ncbi:MAG: wax ester/triacylglycerol synthase family O-acyltransferase [Pseudonocardiaceae bacterium]|nr:wax ester/triacylglycerol synthase family O-acyltransferase [Pseudonocardiaceae bacterium]
MPITDSMFLLVESREHPVHVGGLQLFDLPEGAGPDFLHELHRSLVTGDTGFDPPFGSRPRRTLSSFGQWAWSPDEHLDLEYHVRLSALPRPGRIRELLELVSRLHGALLDRHRPLWEMHLIDGVENGQFAVYTKVHHAVTDGVSALRRMTRALSDDPDARDQAPPWAVDTATGIHASDTAFGIKEIAAGSLRAGGTAARAFGDMVSIPPAFIGALRQGLSERTAALPLRAPRSMLNVPITGARRFAAQSWPLERIRAVCAATGATLNDVVLAMSAGALRRYLLEFDALPDQPLIAMIPVSLRSEATADGGNALGTILCELGTDTADAAERYTRIRRSMKQGKQLFEGLSPVQITALSAAMISPLVAALLPGVTQFAPPPFNIIISNVAGPDRPLYWNGARLRGLYPVSVPVEGQALNITVTTYHDNLEFGLTGCRRRVPHLQRLLLHLEAALDELEKAVCGGGRTGGRVRAGRRR